MSNQKWWFKDEVRVRVTFKYRGMTAEDYAVWIVEEAKAIRLSEVRELVDGVAAYGYDLFEVAWLNLWWYPSEGEPNNTWHSLVRVGDSSLRVVKKQSKVTVRKVTQEDLNRLEAAKKPNLQSWELAERDQMGVEWLRCHAADEAYEVDFATREELDAWRAHEFMNAKEDV